MMRRQMFRGVVNTFQTTQSMSSSLYTTRMCYLSTTPKTLIRFGGNNNKNDGGQQQPPQQQYQQQTQQTTYVHHDASSYYNQGNQQQQQYTNTNVQNVYQPQTSSSSSQSTASDLPPHVREHITRVYALLAAGVAAAACGSSTMIFTGLAKTVPFWLPAVGAFVPLLWLSFAPPANPNVKLALFFTFCFLEGMAIAPVVWMSAAKGVLFSALFLTFAVFAGFTAAAFLAPQGRLLALQGPLFAILIGMVGLSFLNMFWPSKFAHSILLYGGLALFSALIAVDTQNMIE
eukprot:PhF_6_TR4498/c0_g1_i3/m.6234/K21889/TMBIM6, BI1, TEGT; Bax inhibitor 1